MQQVSTTRTAIPSCDQLGASPTLPSALLARHVHNTASASCRFNIESCFDARSVSDNPAPAGCMWHTPELQPTSQQLVRLRSLSSILYSIQTVYPSKPVSSMEVENNVFMGRGTGDPTLYYLARSILSFPSISTRCVAMPGTAPRSLVTGPVGPKWRVP